jgi:dihydroorotate dehydrogenase electron transfer subunit
VTTFAQASPEEVEVGLAAPEPGPRTHAPFGRRLCTVTLNEAVGAYRLVGADDPTGPAPLPGQFYMLSAKEGWGDGATQRPYLARAFSVCRALATRRDFLVEEIGPGTARLATLAPGEGIWLVGPLGIGFTDPEALAGGGESARAVLVAGGIGIAPLVIWRQALAKRGAAASVLAGFRSAAQGESVRLLAGDVAIATDDGSRGHHGLVTDLLERELEDRSGQVVYACGPPRMLEAVRRICAERAVRAQFAMEEAMACGFGACFGCVVRTRSGYRRLCVDGPIVSASDLDESWIAP